MQTKIIGLNPVVFSFSPKRRVSLGDILVYVFAYQDRITSAPLEFDKSVRLLPDLYTFNDVFTGPKVRGVRDKLSLEYAFYSIGEDFDYRAEQRVLIKASQEGDRQFLFIEHGGAQIPGAKLDFVNETILQILNGQELAEDGRFAATSTNVAARCLRQYNAEFHYENINDTPYKVRAVISFPIGFR
ncbi:MAG: hypothetical protein PHV30_08985 [Candidatus Margulisbacteria bacterium]|nr:hypothetical protein [Candidatus Margulisiibacteriota bacterium]